MVRAPQGILMTRKDSRVTPRTLRTTTPLLLRINRYFGPRPNGIQWAVPISRMANLTCMEISNDVIFNWTCDLFFLRMVSNGNLLKRCKTRATTTPLPRAAPEAHRSVYSTSASFQKAILANWCPKLMSFLTSCMRI